MENNRGKFIVFEGNAASGKTHQANKLAHRLKENVTKATYEKEPTNGPIGNLIRNYFLMGGYFDDPITNAFLYSGDRYDHITNPTQGLLAKLNDGINVICERFYLSTIVYESFKHRGEDIYWSNMSYMLNLNNINHKLLKPDLTIMLQVDPEVSMDRLENRNTARSIYKRDIDTIKAIYDTYNDAIEYLHRTWREEVTIIDGNDDSDRIHDRIWSIVYPLLNHQ